MLELTTKTYDTERLLFRRQFVLGPRFAGGFPTWQRLAISRRHFLTAHPDLQVHHASRGERSLTLLGYLLDPYNPEIDSPTILEGLLSGFRGSELQSLIEATAALAGRWVLIAREGESVWLFNDPVGLRQVFFSTAVGSPAWCGSQPGLLAEVIGLETDPARAESLVAASRRVDGQYWWPADLTPYAELRGLLPNHVLALDSREMRRYWPAEDIPSGQPMDAVVTEAARILEGTLAAAARRFPLAVALTAGLDSRMLLAASRRIKDDVQFFTLLFWGAGELDADARVASDLARRFGLDHAVVRCPEASDEEWTSLTARNVPGARPVYGQINQATYETIADDRLAVYGNVSEIARCFYHASPSANGGPVTAELLALKARMGGELAVEALGRWLSEAQSAAHNVDILDLFYWEQRMGGWLALTQAERDLAQEVLMPFNCRALIEMLLSVDEARRRPPDYDLFRALIARMWPETLAEPINPGTQGHVLRRIAGGARSRTAAVLRRLSPSH